MFTALKYPNNIKSLLLVGRNGGCWGWGLLLFGEGFFGEGFFGEGKLGLECPSESVLTSVALEVRAVCTFVSEIKEEVFSKLNTQTCF